ncbi:MAG TPA: putative porin, partial [Bordetella sp.]|nr:putative porin [Bordetella sp.]
DPPSANATINLIRLLVKQGVLTQGQADALVKQAESEAQQARTSTATAASAGAVGGAALAQPGDVRVPYIPETVRDQIRDEVKAEVVAQAKEENWAQPNTFPDWVSRITFDGDMRVRDESRLFDSGNSDEIIDFAKWNQNGPIATVIANTPYGLDIPYMNTRQDRRNLWRIRARVGLKAQISEQWMAGVRLGTGSDDSPVSSTQTLGGGMSKKDIWLDQAYLKYSPTDWVTLTAGRAANPFVSTDMLYSGDLNFDGVSAVFKKPLEGRPVTVFGTLGAFALEYANNPWSDSDWGEGESENKWLLGAQIGADWKPSTGNRLRGSLAYYYFDNVAGQRSSPCTVYSADDVCSTDWSRPAFMQKGNTLFLLRDIRQWSSNPDDWNEWQYVGLASKFNLLDVNLIWDTQVFDDMGLRLHGNYVRNLAYDKGDMISRAGGAENIVNSRQNLDDIESGPNAWMLQATLGRGLELREKNDWMVFAGYKYIQPDAMPDAFNDSTFHLGGTNARGYFLGGGYAFDKNVYGLLRWTSTKEVYGPPLAIDVIQAEINARF